MTDLLEKMDGFLDNPPQACGMLLLCMTFDFITGVYASYKNGEQITSKRMREGLVDKFKWIIGVSFGYSVQYVIDYNGIVIAIVGFGVATELLSISENFRKIGILKGGSNE